MFISFFAVAYSLPAIVSPQPAADPFAALAADAFVNVEAPQAEEASELSVGRFSYRFAEAELAIGDLTGLRVAGSYPIQDSIYATGALSLLSGDEGFVDVDLFALSAGATYVHTMSEQLDLLATAELEYGRLEASAFGFSASDSEIGLRIRGGARYAIDEQIEVFGGATIRTIFDSDFMIEGGARYQITDDFAVQARLELGDDTVFNIGARYSF